MNIQEELKFEKVNGNPPSFTCNGCGQQTKPEDDVRIATVKPFVDESFDFSVVACSQRCEDILTRKDMEIPVNLMVGDGIMRSATHSGVEIKDEYVNWIESLGGPEI